MKTTIIFLLVSTLLISSCDKPEYKWGYYGSVTSLRLDDDAEYHFSTDIIVRSDVRTNRIFIYRKPIPSPILYIYEMRCPEGKTCNEATDQWRQVGSPAYGKYKIEIPLDYKIETFDD